MNNIILIIFYLVIGIAIFTIISGGINNIFGNVQSKDTYDYYNNTINTYENTQQPINNICICSGIEQQLCGDRNELKKMYVNGELTEQTIPSCGFSNVVAMPYDRFIMTQKV